MMRWLTGLCGTLSKKVWCRMSKKTDDFLECLGYLGVIAFCIMLGFAMAPALGIALLVICGYLILANPYC